MKKKLLLLAAGILALSLLSINCSSYQEEDSPVIKYTPPIKPIDPGVYKPVVNNFFILCENDIKKSAEAISGKRLFFYLQHFNKMDSGGNRYYILEKETITDMINSLSSYKYTECYLINNKGIIIYTMYNKEFLGKHIDSYIGSPLYRLYSKSMNSEPGIEDVSSFPDGKKHDLYFSNPVVTDKKIEGVVIASMDIDQIGKQLPMYSKIIDKNGVFKYHYNQEMVFQKDIDFAKIETAPKTLDKSLIKTSDGDMAYQPFEYKTISWYLIIRQANGLAKNL